MGQSDWGDVVGAAAMCPHFGALQKLSLLQNPSAERLLLPPLEGEGVARRLELRQIKSSNVETIKNGTQ